MVYILKPYLWFCFLCITRFIKSIDSFKQPPSDYVFNFYIHDTILKYYIWFTNSTDYYILEEMKTEILVLSLIILTFLVLIIGKMML